MSDWFPVTDASEVPFDIDEIEEIDSESEILSNPTLMYEYLKKKAFILNLCSVISTANG